MNNYKKNKSLLEKTHNYSQDMEHDACGVGLIASTNGRRRVILRWQCTNITSSTSFQFFHKLWMIFLSKAIYHSRINNGSLTSCFSSVVTKEEHIMGRVRILRQLMMERNRLIRWRLIGGKYDVFIG